MFSKKNKLAVIATLATASGIASAELPAAVGTALTSIQADGVSMMNLGWPVLAAILGITVLFKLFKRVVSSAT